MIPKIIHYCWLSNDPIPREIQQYMSSWKKYLPDFEFILWNFDRFDINSSLWVKQAFNAKKYAFAADYIRLFALYNYGGFYLDMDVEVLHSFNPLLQLNSALCYENNGKVIEAATMGTEKKSEWVGRCLDYYRDRSFVKEDGTYDMVPLPQIIMSILKKSYKPQSVKSIDDAIRLDNNNNVIPILSSDFFSPKSYASGKIKITSNSYSIHHFQGTWLPWYVLMEKRISYFLHIRYRDFLNRKIINKK